MKVFKRKNFELKNISELIFTNALNKIEIKELARFKIKNSRNYSF